MIKITNIIDDIEDAATIENVIRKSNYWATELNFSVTDYYYVVAAANGSYTNAILETNIVAQKTFIEQGKVVYGLSSCRSHEHNNLISS